MKTTIELSDDLARAARQYATRHGLTLRAIIEDGIRTTLRTEQETRTRFTLRDASVEGSGLQAEYRSADWSTIRAAAYGRRGG